MLKSPDLHPTASCVVQQIINYLNAVPVGGTLGPQARDLLGVYGRPACRPPALRPLGGPSPEALGSSHPQ